MGVKDLKRTETHSQGRKGGGKRMSLRMPWQVGCLHHISPCGSTVSVFPSLPSMSPERLLVVASP